MSCSVRNVRIRPKRPSSDGCEVSEMSESPLGLGHSDAPCGHLPRTPRRGKKLNDPARQHRPTNPALLAREGRELLGLGLSIPDAAAALGMTPRALADLLDHVHMETVPCV